MNAIDILINIIKGLQALFGSRFHVTWGVWVFLLIVVAVAAKSIFHIQWGKLFRSKSKIKCPGCRQQLYVAKGQDPEFVCETEGCPVKGVNDRWFGQFKIFYRDGRIEYREVRWF